jgi:hypothetical protein
MAGGPGREALGTDRDDDEDGARAMSAQLLDPMPIGVVFVLFAIITLICYEVGFRLGRWWQERMPGEQEGPTDVLVGSLLALMAFLLAVTMSMASDRFDTRRGIVLAEANAIGTAYAQADYLPDPAAEQLRELLREYLPLRIATGDTAQVQANLQLARELQPKLWAVFRPVMRSGHSPDLMSSLGDSLTAIVEVDETRVISALYARVPETVLLILLAGSALALGMVGYSAGLKGRRSVLSAIVMVVALGVVLALVIDLDRPQDGLINVSQQPLTDVQARIGQPGEG